MSLLEKAWHNNARWLIFLWPLSVLFRFAVRLRRRVLYPATRPDSHTAAVVVIGNLSVGGTGKTPFTINLAQQLLARNMKVGVISRGYGGHSSSYPLSVNEQTPVRECGDEAILIVTKTSCPMVVGPDREAALRQLLAENNIDVVLSDDGLQHYRLHRDVEIAIVDGQRLFSNGWCLPAGPLREPPARLKQVDFIITNGSPDSETAHAALLNNAHPMSLSPRYLINQISGEKRPFGGAPFNIGNTVQAVAALGNPQRFFKLLEQLPYPVRAIQYPDHHQFQEEDFRNADIDIHQPVVMTEKDAVKCKDFAQPNFWTLVVEVELPNSLISELTAKICDITERISRA